MVDIDELMKRHGVHRAGCAWFGSSVCCWVNRDPPAIWFGITFDSPLPKESVYAGQSGWDKLTQKWVVKVVFETAYCCNCGTDTRLVGEVIS